MPCVLRWRKIKTVNPIETHPRYWCSWWVVEWKWIPPLCEIPEIGEPSGWRSSGAWKKVEEDHKELKLRQFITKYQGNFGDLSMQISTLNYNG